MKPRTVQPLGSFLLMAANILVLLLVLASVVSAQPRNATTGTRTEAALETQQAGDTARFRARWAFACDAAGCPDSVLITWTLNGAGRPTRGTRATRDTVWTLRTVCPGVTTASATIVAMRRGRASAQLVRSATMGCRDAAPPPVDSFAIDTGTVWRTARRVDSLPPKGGYWYDVLRADSTHAMVDVFRDPKTQAITGAQVRAATTCEGMWWPLGDTTSVRVAQARAAQWPTDTLTARATRAFRAFDYTGCAYCQVWQGRCG